MAPELSVSASAGASRTGLPLIASTVSPCSIGCPCTSGTEVTTRRSSIQPQATGAGSVPAGGLPSPFEADLRLQQGSEEEERERGAQHARNLLSSDGENQRGQLVERRD